MVAELRRVVNDPRDPRRKQAARQLSRLAEAGIPGANPAEWTNLRTPSTDEELIKGAVSLSPSRIEQLLNCPLRAVLDRLDSEEETPIAMLKGTLVHAFAGGRRWRRCGARRREGDQRLHAAGERAELVARKHRNCFSTHPLTYRYLAEDFSRRFYGSGNGDGRIGDHR